MGYYHKRKVRIALHRRIWEDGERYTRHWIKKNMKIRKFYAVDVSDTRPSIFTVQLPGTTIFCVSDSFIIKDYECKTSRGSQN